MPTDQSSAVENPDALLHLQIAWCGFYALSKQDLRAALGVFRGLFHAQLRTELSLTGYALALYQECGNTQELDRHLPEWSQFSTLTRVIDKQLRQVMAASIGMPGPTTEH